MPTQQQREPPTDLEQHKREMLHALIREQVLHALGEPDELLKVQVRPLWGGRYRVNVFVGKEVTTATLAHSYFLQADGDGNVLASTPTIARQY